MGERVTLTVSPIHAVCIYLLAIQFEYKKIPEPVGDFFIQTISSRADQSSR